MNWQSPDTLPRDGRPVLFHGRDGERGVACFKDRSYGDDLRFTTGSAAFAHQRRGDSDISIYMRAIEPDDVVAWMEFPAPTESATKAA